MIKVFAYLSAPSDAQPAQAVTDVTKSHRYAGQSCTLDHPDSWPCPICSPERARSSQPPTAAQPAAVPAECVFRVGQRVIWKSSLGVQWPAQIEGVNPETYYVRLDDGTHVHSAIAQSLSAAPPPPTSAESGDKS